MKILIASDLYPPVINGVATFSRNLAVGLARLGHEVAVIAPSQTGKKEIEICDGYTLYRTRSVPFPFYQNIRVSPAPQLEVKKIIQEFEPDVIHIQMLLGIGQAVMSYGRKYRIPIISTSHAMPENLMENLDKMSIMAGPISYVLQDYGRRFHSRADIVTSPTESGIYVFGKHAEKIAKPIEVVSNGIDLARFTPGDVDPELYRRFSLPVGVPIVSYLGRVDAEKHIWVLVRAMETVLQSVNAHLMIVGSGVDIERLQQLVDELGLHDKVTFTGRVSDEDMVQLHKVGTVFCMPSPAELQSIATLEAMASGQPVVAVNAGALGELCHDGINGFLFDLDDDRHAAEGLVKILTDPRLRSAMSKSSLAIAKTHDIATTLHKFVELYQRAIQTKQLETDA